MVAPACFTSAAVIALNVSIAAITVPVTIAGSSEALFEAHLLVAIADAAAAEFILDGNARNYDAQRPPHPIGASANASWEAAALMPNA